MFPIIKAIHRDPNSLAVLHSYHLYIASYKLAPVQSALPYEHLLKVFVI